MQKTIELGASAPLILEHPEDTTVRRNDPVALRCDADGEPPPDIRWWKDGFPIVAASPLVKVILRVASS